MTEKKITEMEINEVELNETELTEVNGGFGLTTALLIGGAWVASGVAGYAYGKYGKKKIGICY